MTKKITRAITKVSTKIAIIEGEEITGYTMFTGLKVPSQKEIKSIDHEEGTQLVAVSHVYTTEMYEMPVEKFLEYATKVEVKGGEVE